MSLAEEKTRISWAEKEQAILELVRNGSVNPEALIEAARDPEHACHNDFTWNVQQAASERWRDQARALIRKVTVQVEFGEVTIPIVQFVSSGDEDANFISLPKIRKHSDVKELMLREVGQLLGVTSRVLGIALSKESILGKDFVQKMASVRSQLAAIKEGLEE